MIEIEAAKIAENKGNAEEKKFAGQMVTDHTKTSSDLKGLVSSGAVKADIPATLDSASQKKLNELRQTKPDDFAGVYDPMQVSAHKDAVRCSIVTRNQATMPSSRTGPGKLCRLCNIISRWPRI
jgi:putative membrane protein